MDLHPTRAARLGFDQEERSLLQLARRLIGHVEADDMVQDTWVAALESGWDRSIENSAWLRAVLRKRVCFARRSAARRRIRETDSARPETIELAGDHSAHAIQERLLALVDSLHEPERSVIRLRFWNDLGLTEVARRLGRSHNTVKGQYRRGIQTLRNKLDRQSDGGREAWMPALTGWIAATDRRGCRPESAVHPLSVTSLFVAGIAVLGLTSLVLAFRALEMAPVNGPEIDRDVAVSSGSPALFEQEALERRPIDALDLAGPRPESPESTNRVRSPNRAWRVRAVDVSGRAVEGARVFLNGRTHEAVTDGGGRAELAIEEGARNELARDLLPGRLTFFGEHDDHLRTADYFVDPGFPATTEISLVFEHAFQTVRGRVLDRAGRPLVDVAIGVFDHAGAYLVRPDGIVLISPEEHVRSDVEGRFEVPGRMESGTLIRAEKDGWAPFVGDVTQATNEEGIVEIKLGPGVVLSGVVSDEDGRTVDGARVRFTSFGGCVLHEAKADEHGRYQTASLPPGEHLLWAHHPSVVSRYASERLVAVPGEELAWSPRLTEHRPFRVRVLDPEGGALSGLLCQLQNNEWFDSEETDEHGSTRPFEVYPDASVAIVVRDVAYPNAMPILVVNDRIPDGEDIEVLLLPGAREFAPFRGIVHACDGRPPGEDFSLTLLQESTRMVMPWFDLDADTGVFAAQPQPPGVYTLAVSMRSSGMHLFPPFELAPGRPLDMGILVLPATGSLAVRVLGHASAASSFSLERVHQLGALTTYLFAGNHPLENAQAELRLVPATYWIRAWRDELEVASSTVTVVAGMTSDLVLGE